MELTFTSCTEKKKTDKFTVYEAVDNNGTKYDAFEVVELNKPVTVEIVAASNPAYNSRVKVIKKNGFNGRPAAAPKGNESFALSYAKDLVVSGKVEIKDILPIADKLFNWLESKRKP